MPEKNSMKKQQNIVTHPFGPVYDRNSKVLVLGTLPSERSREEGFYYAHPTNQFWRLIAAVCGCEVPRTVDEKKQLLLGHGIALWDVFSSASINRSSDGSIRRSDARGCDVTWLGETKIRAIFVNGKKALDGYNWFLRGQTKLDAIYLPSSSAANAGKSFEQKLAAWMIIKNYL